MSTSVHSTTTVDTTEIRYSRETRDYDVLDNGRYITSASTYSQAEAKRMEYLSSLRADAIPAPDTWSDRYEQWHAKREAEKQVQQ